MDADGIARVGLINYVSPDVMGFTEEANAWMINYASTDPARLIAFGSVNPRFSRDVAGDTARVIEAGAKALKVHPPHQLFRANAYQESLPQLADLYRVAQDAGIPVTIHTGTSVFPGARSRLGDPMDVDDVAVDFPKLTILLAHGGRPLWMDAAFFLVRRHPNVQLEVSGIPPAKLLEYFPRLEEIANKTIWGTDWPSPGIKSMRTNVDVFNDLPLSAAAKHAVLSDNAARIWQA
jgi:predicted TIM-barrel fold metal-dependent hydrolase